MKINIIGSGNVATQLAIWLFNNNVTIESIYSKNYKNAKVLAEKVDASYTDQISDLIKADLNIISVSDSAIEKVAKKLSKDIPTIHTSGGSSIAILKGFENYGIIYPLQTFSKDVKIEIDTVPFFIEASNKNFESQLLNFTGSYLSKNCQIANSDVRKHLHLAAIITSNFLTYFLGAAESILIEKKLPLQVLQPLLEETLRKSIDKGPVKSLTGPAARGDRELLKDYSDLIVDSDFKSIFISVNKMIIDKEFTVL